MKKGLLITSITSIMAITAGCAFAISANKGIRFEAVKAQARSVVYNATTNLPGDAGEYNKSGYSSYEATPAITGDAVITKAYAYSGGSSRDAQFGERVISAGEADEHVPEGKYTHFMSFAYSRHGDYNGSFYVEIGVNNATAFSISLGTAKDYAMHCDVEAFSTSYYDGMKVVHTYEFSTEAGKKTKTFSADDVSTYGQEIHYLRFYVYSNESATWYLGDYFIDSISVNWSC